MAWKHGLGWFTNLWQSTLYSELARSKVTYLSSDLYLAQLRSQFRDAAKQRYKHCSTGQEGLADVIESLLEISLRIHENLVSKIRSCNVVYLLVICWFSDPVCFAMCSCICQGRQRFLVLSMTGGRGWFSISRTCVTSMWHAGTEVVEGPECSFLTQSIMVNPPQQEGLFTVCTFVLQKRQSWYMRHASLVNRCCTLQQCWDDVFVSYFQER